MLVLDVPKKCRKPRQNKKIKHIFQKILFLSNFSNFQVAYEVYEHKRHKKDIKLSVIFQISQN